MRAGRRLALAAVPVIAALATVPAWLLDRALADTPLALVDVGGSLWQGKAWLALRPGPEADAASGNVPLLPLAWAPAWRSGPGLRLVTAAGEGWLGWRQGGLLLESPPFELALSRLPLPMPLGQGGLSGMLRAGPGRIHCPAPQRCAGSLPLRLQGLALRLFPGEHLADAELKLDVSPQGPRLEANLLPGGALTGHLRLEPGDPLRASGLLQATPAASPALVRALNSLGTPGPEGVVIERR